MNARGHQNFTYTFDISDADAGALNSEAICQEAIRDLISLGEMTELQSLTHQFEPQGISVVTLLAESHIALHTWPELGTGYITFTTCKKPGEAFTEAALQQLQTVFSTKAVEAREV